MLSFSFFQFFEPITPLDIDIIYESSGRPSGTAKVTFANGDDVTRAMGKVCIVTKKCFTVRVSDSITN